MANITPAPGAARKTSTAVRLAAVTEKPNPDAGMFEVRLSRIVTLPNGHSYNPRFRNVVDAATKDLLGDAVVDAEQL